MITLYRGGKGIRYLYNTLRVSMNMAWGYYATALLIVVSVYVLLKREKPEKRLVACLLAGYLFLVFSSALLRRNIYSGIRYRLEPFLTLRLIWKYGITRTGYRLAQMVLNVLMLLPIGLLMPVLEKRKGVLLLIGFLFSLILETLQFVLKRGCFDVDDLICNTLGIVIGYGIYKVFRVIFREANERLSNDK